MLFKMTRHISVFVTLIHLVIDKYFMQIVHCKSNIICRDTDGGCSSEIGDEEHNEKDSSLLQV